VRLGRFEALPNPSLGADAWDITEADASVEGGKRKIGEALSRIGAESDLLRRSVRAVLGEECMTTNLSEGPSR
jgi:hypothetical protein